MNPRKPPIESTALARDRQSEKDAWMAQPAGKRAKRRRSSLEMAQLASEAAQLSQAGWSNRQIAERLGCHHSTVRKMIERACRDVLVPAITDLRAKENAEIDQDMAVLQDRIDRPPYRHNVQGHLLYDPDGHPEIDADAVTRAIDARTRLRARRARMNGYDVPQVTVQVKKTQQEIDQAVANIITQLQGLPPPPLQLERSEWSSDDYPDDDADAPDSDA
jgi:Helix-turn-helix domain